MTIDRGEMHAALWCWAHMVRDGRDVATTVMRHVDDTADVAFHRYEVNNGGRF